MAVSRVGWVKMRCERCGRVTHFEVMITKKTRKFSAYCRAPHAARYSKRCDFKLEEPTRLALAIARAQAATLPMPTDTQLRMPIWNALSNFKRYVMKTPQLCQGCGTIMNAGAIVLRLSQALNPGRKRLTVVTVHGDNCWAEWEARYWEAKAQRRDELVAGVGSQKEVNMARTGLPVMGRRLFDL